MSILLDNMVNSLIADAPPSDGVPNEEQYERMVKEAVRDFGRRAGRIKRATLTIVTGTATYDLPADFLKLIKLDRMFGHDGIMNTPAGLIPVGSGWHEEYTILGGTITFYPTPTYSMVRWLSYKAGWVLSGDTDYTEVYEELTEEEAEIILLKAKSLTLGMQANLSASDGWKYQIGDEMVDKSGQHTSYASEGDAADAAYLKAVESYNGNTGMAG